jgi:hypothetical protein
VFFDEHFTPLVRMNEKINRKLRVATEVGSTCFGCWSVDKYEKLIVGPDSVQNF